MENTSSYIYLDGEKQHAWLNRLWSDHFKLLTPPEINEYVVERVEVLDFNWQSCPKSCLTFASNV